MAPRLSTLPDDTLGTLIGQLAAALPEPPVAVQHSLFELWTSSRAAPRTQPAADALRRFVALLKFDSWATPGLALGMRGAAGPARHLLYSAEGNDVDLRIAPQPQGYSVRGQVLGPGETGVVELAEQDLEAIGAHAARVTSLNALGEFRIDGVPKGTYLLSLRIGTAQIVLPPLDIGSSTS